MRYAQIRKMDISNGEGCGISLFTQGCPICCKDCHNASIWSFEGGKPWTLAAQEQIIELMKPDYIVRFSVLGGEPLLPQNVADLADLVQRIKQCYPDKKIWLWSGYVWQQIYVTAYDMSGDVEEIPQDICTIEEKRALQTILETIDILVDGPFIQEQRDITLKWRGSENQHIIDVKKTLSQKKPATKPILYCD